MSTLSEHLRELYCVDEMSPEEFAARNSHTLGMFASHLEHGDEQLAKWFKEVETILDSEELLSEAMRKFLTPAEIQDIEAYLEDDAY